MNSHYAGLYCALDGDKICVDGNRFTIFADMNEIGVITKFVLLDNDKKVSELEADAFLELSKMMSLMSGEQMRRTVQHIKEKKEQQ